MWAILVLAVGFLYGWLKPGVQDKSQILVRGLVFGLILGILLALLGYSIGSNPIYMGGFLGLVLGVIVMTLLFILGTWVGDLVEGKPKRVA